MIEIKLYNKSNIDELKWPDTPDASLARAHLLPMIQEGVDLFIQNITTKLYLLKVNDALLPLTVNQKEYYNSYLTSNFFPIRYLEEQAAKNPSFLQLFQKSLLTSAGLFLKGVKINKVVIVNNWLFTTNIYPSLSAEEIEGVTEYLCHQFPDHALIFRSLNTCRCQGLIQTLQQLKYRLMFARSVSVYNPQLKEHFSPKVLYHHRRDRRLIETEGYEIVHYDKPQTEEINHLLDLYKALYLDRHTKYSPQYTLKFLKEAIEKKLLHLVCLKKEGSIDGVIGFHERGKTLIAPFCGYDQTKKEASQLYRMLTMLAIDEAEKRDVLLNDGSGGEAPKKYRGMQSFPEYVALFDNHLPLTRRLFWGLAEKMVKRFGISKINKEG